MGLVVFAVRAPLPAILKVLLALLGVGDRRVAVVDPLVEVNQLLDPTAALVLEIIPLPGRIVDRDRAVGTEANVVRRPRHFRIRLTEDISRDGLSMRSPVKLGSRRRRHVRLRQLQRSKRSRASTLVGGALIPAPATAAGQSTL